jgi:diguanylate cyclase (GGDEF)-like protein/putative nucleotidyltransferase with HDIG domain
MAIFSHSSIRQSVPQAVRAPVDAPRSLPATLRRRDIVLFIILAVVMFPDVQGMQFAGISMFFYWFLALITFMLPCIYITGWLTCQTPRNVPVYVWAMRLLDARWRSFILFLVWWIGVLALFAVLGMCLCVLQTTFPGLHSTFALQCGAFVFLLGLATVIGCLPLRIGTTVLWICGLFYVAFFGILALTALVSLFGGNAASNVAPHAVTEVLPGSFSWIFFGMALLSLLGLNAPLLMEGEVREADRCSGRFPGYFWLGSLISFVILVLAGVSVLVVNLPGSRDPLVQIGRVFGPTVHTIAGLLLLAGCFGIVLVYLLMFSRALFLSAQQGYLPRYLAKLSRSGVPWRAFLAQSVLITGGAAILFVAFPLIFRRFFPDILFIDLVKDDQFTLLTSIAGSLWAWLTVLMFVFALWIFCKKQGRRSRKKSERIAMWSMCLVGCGTSLICVLAPLGEGWSTLFFSHAGWFSLVLLGIVSSLILSWLVSELPRRSALLCAKEKRLAREKALHEELHHVYTRECDLHNRLREAYDEQQISILQQKILLDDLNRLYHEQERAAITDAVTGLPNHRAFIKRLDEEIVRCRDQHASFLLFFVDLDHFKEINDTWGHLAGDAVLGEVACRLSGVVQPEGFVGRYGGEEFALLLSDVQPEGACSIAQRLRAAISSVPYNWKCAQEIMTGIFVTASIGVAVYGIHGTQSEELIKQADLAMYQAKLEGRNCVRMAQTDERIGQEQNLMVPGGNAHRQDYLDRLLGDEERGTLVSVQAVQALMAVVQVRDLSLGSHSYRMIHLAEETGRGLGLACEDLFLIRLGALLHDIGKLGVPDAVLNKAGPLNEDEWELMHKHPLIGARILGEVGGAFQVLAQIVMAHHERWDGYGYPRGLKKQEIPLVARILSVVDAYDAMVSRRVYKEPMSIEAAEAEIRRCAGTQFDPAVAEAFLALPKREEPGRACIKTGPHQLVSIEDYALRTVKRSSITQNRGVDEIESGGAGYVAP